MKNVARNYRLIVACGHWAVLRGLHRSSHDEKMYMTIILLLPGILKTPFPVSFGDKSIPVQKGLIFFFNIQADD